MSEIKPTFEDKNSPLWHKLDAATKGRLESLRRQNDGDLDVLKTAILRGRISELKKLRAELAMDTSPTQTVDAG